MNLMYVCTGKGGVSWRYYAKGLSQQQANLNRSAFLPALPAKWGLDEDGSIGGNPLCTHCAELAIITLNLYFIK
jgi:hypothetical protein